MNRRNSFFEKLQRFMYGRYGQIDALNKFMLVTALVLYLLGPVISRVSVAGFFVSIIALALFITVVARMFSRNVYKRSAENMKYYELSNKVKDFFKGRKTGNGNVYGNAKEASDKDYRRGATTAKVRPVRDPAYKYFKCFKCKKNVRVPKNHGKVELTCKNCGHTFVRYTGKRVVK